MKTRDETIPDMSKIANDAYGLLKAGQSAVDVSCYAVQTMEDSGLLNAGIGSCLTSELTIEMDAGIMDGKTMQCGGIGAIKNIKNPIKVAMQVMYKSKHSLFAGEQAFEFARQSGVQKYEMVPMPSQIEKSKQITEKFGTVGAVVIDKNEDTAAAVSTGGMWNKTPGRVGDSAIVGAGYYAKNGAGAAVATGDGDILMKSCISKKICDLLNSGRCAQGAADFAIQELGRLEGGKGGVIVLDKRGDIGVSFNTETMTLAHCFSS